MKSSVGLTSSEHHLSSIASSLLEKRVTVYSSIAWNWWLVWGQRQSDLHSLQTFHRLHGLVSSQYVLVPKSVKTALVKTPNEFGIQLLIRWISFQHLPEVQSLEIVWPPGKYYYTTMTDGYYLSVFSAMKDEKFQARQHLRRPSSIPLMFNFKKSLNSSETRCYHPFYWDKHRYKVSKCLLV